MLVPIHAGGISIGLEQQKEKKHNKLAMGGSGKSSLVGTRLAFFPLQEICVRINHKYTQAQNTHTHGGCINNLTVSTPTHKRICTKKAPEAPGTQAHLSALPVCAVIRCLPLEAGACWWCFAPLWPG